jgi:hypothetical protein
MHAAARGLERCSSWRPGEVAPRKRATRRQPGRLVARLQVTGREVTSNCGHVSSVSDNDGIGGGCASSG